MYAPLEKIGQEVKCPDCHTRNLVPPLKEAAAPDKQAGPTLEGTEEFGMSEVVERPKYRPVVAPRGEYELLSALDPAKIEHRLTVPGEQPRRKQHPQVATAEQFEGEEGGDEDVTLAPEVERVQLGVDPRTIRPQPQLEAENELYDGRYDDGVIGDLVDPREPDAWKRAPLVYGIVEFLFYPGTLARWLGVAALLAIVVTLGQWVVAGVLGDSGFAQARGAMTVFAFVPLAAVCVIYSSAVLYAIVERTANGERDISEWPGLNFLEWIPTAVYWIAATIVACLPGAAIGVLTMATSSDWGLAAFAIGAPPVLSWLLLFPPVLFSMLAEGSFLSIYSPHTAASFASAASAWVFFYMYAIIICLLAVLAGSCFLLGNIVGTLCGALGLTAVLFVDARLIGRVMWVAAQKSQ
jgi:hypothetical protein